MRRGRTFSIAGTVVRGSESAASLRLMLHRFEAGVSSSSSVVVLPGGRFELADVQPGDYAISAYAVNPEHPDHPSGREAAFISFSVADDVKDLVIPLIRTVDVPGRLRLEDETLTLPDGRGSSLVAIARMATARPVPSLSGEHSDVAPDRTFVLKGLFAPRRISIVNLPNGWFVKSIRYGGRDITDEAIDFKADRGELDVLLSNRGAVVTGQVLDERGKTLRGSRVLLFKADKDMAAHAPYAEAVASDGGAFRLGPQRSGDYVVVALAPGEPSPQWHQHDRLAAFRDAGERITLSGESEITINLTALRK